MRIAHVTDFYLPRLGGIEMHVNDLSERQRAQGHEVEILTSSPGSCDHEGHVHRVTDDYRHPHAVHPLAVRAGIRTLDRLAPDVVHAHLGVASPLAFFLARAASRRGIPTVVTVHSMWAGVRPIMRTMDVLGGWSDLPITWTAVSQAAARPVANILPPSIPIHILANGIEQEQWRLPAPAETTDELTLVAVMRLARRKRPIALLKMVLAAQQALDAAGDPTRLRLVVAGDGPRRAAMEGWIRRHAMGGSVSLLGRLDRAAVHDLLGRSHAFLAPADLESFGIAALEARCSGLPVIAKAQGGVGEFVRHEQEGLLVHSDADMVDAIVRLARDPQLRRSIAAHNRTQACPVAWAPLLQATDAAYVLATEAAAAVGQPGSSRTTVSSVSR